MTTLTLTKLAEIEEAASNASQDASEWWEASRIGEAGYIDSVFIAACDPQTVAALCRIARELVKVCDHWTCPDALTDALRASGLIE